MRARRRPVYNYHYHMRTESFTLFYREQCFNWENTPRNWTFLTGLTGVTPTDSKMDNFRDQFLINLCKLSYYILKLLGNGTSAWVDKTKNLFAEVLLLKPMRNLKLVIYTSRSRINRLNC